MRRPLTALIALASVLPAVGGCGSLSQRRDDARAAATRFEQALAARHFEALCDQLAPATREEIEQSSRTDCARGVPEADLPPGGRVGHVDVHGRQARAVLASDTVFLSRFPQGWKVTAAGCEERPEQPYQCSVKGG